MGITPGVKIHAALECRLQSLSRLIKNSALEPRQNPISTTSVCRLCARLRANPQVSGETASAEPPSVYCSLIHP